MIDPIKAFNEVNNFGRENGMVLKVIEPGVVEYRMTIEEKHLSSPGTCHGGVVAGFMDSVIGMAALSYAFTKKMLVSTVEFKLNYFRPVKQGEELVGRGVIDFAGKSLISSNGEIYSINKQGEEKLVSKGMGTFNLYPISKNENKQLFKGMI